MQQKCFTRSFDPLLNFVYLEEVGLAISISERGIYVWGKLFPRAANASGIATGYPIVRQFPIMFSWKFSNCYTLFRVCDNIRIGRL